MDFDGSSPLGLYAKIKSPTLTWETINTLDIGVDAYFINNQLGLVFDWFERNTLDMFGPSMILPSTLGTIHPGKQCFPGHQRLGTFRRLERQDQFQSGLFGKTDLGRFQIQGYQISE